MFSKKLRRHLLVLAATAMLLHAASAPAPGPFFEANQPFFQSQVELVSPPKGQIAGGNFIVRGILLPLPSGYCVLFDQELLRVAGLWKIPADSTPVTLTTMAQISYAVPNRKTGAEHPKPTGPALLITGMHPGVAGEIAALFTDPRAPAMLADAGRGALPATFARFEGIELAGATAVLRYRSGETTVREWLESRGDSAEPQIRRHFEIAPHAQPLHFALGAATESSPLRFATNSAAFTVSEHAGEFVATLAPSAALQRVTLAIIFSSTATAVAATPPLPAKSKNLRWPGTATARAQLESVQQNGLTLDRIATPDENPWRRRVRVADLAFLTDNRAAVVTFDGDVWLLDGLADPKLAALTWRRFASGLHEPLAIIAPHGVIQVATKNGVVRLHDRDGNGEADWFENFNDQLLQSQTTRSFPLDMAIGPDGSTFISQGGIVTRSGQSVGGEGTAQTGGILIAPDGRSSVAFATGAREPFLAVHPATGVVTATDQQGHYIPSSVSYLVRAGDDFGFLQAKPAKLAPPLVWVPYDQDNSSSSEAWMIGAGMGAWNGRLLHLSFGTGRIFVISPDLDAPTPQGAVIPLDLKTDLPLLHARMNPGGSALFLAGFQIWGTRATTNWALGRLRPGRTPIVTAIAARSCTDGVVLEFAEPLDPASLRQENVTARAWNYQRSSAYGSGRYTIEGPAGTTPWAIGQTILSSDKKSVFIHLPQLPPVMQLEVRHDFRLASGVAARGVAFFTIHRQHPLNFAQAGFPKVDLTKSVAVVTRVKQELPTAAMGKALAESLGCAVCHSIDGTTEGKVGPTWKGLFGAKRTFVDGTSDIADELYLREKILDPQQKKVKAGIVEMPSYRGVLSEQQLEAMVLYIKSLAGRRPLSDG